MFETSQTVVKSFAKYVNTCEGPSHVSRGESSATELVFTSIWYRTVSPYVISMPVIILKTDAVFQ